MAGIKAGRAVRFTPACAGRSYTVGVIKWHPDGSPPRARGDPQKPRPGGLTQRVHPRVRGEIRGQRPGHAHVVGFTPACAGRSVGTGPDLVWRGVHPRVRGEIPL